MRKTEFTRSDFNLIRQVSKNFIQEVDYLPFEIKQQLVRTTISQVIISGRVQGTYHKSNDLPGVEITLNINELLLDSLRVVANDGRRH